MSNFIDDGNEEVVETSSIEELTPETQEQPPQEETSVQETQQATEDEDIPEKYKGKQLKDIVRMHQEAERALGRQGSEVGELRRIVDDFVRSQSVNSQRSENSSSYGLRNTPQTHEPDEEIDFFADPQKAIARAIEKHPKVREAEVVAQSLRKAEALAKLKNEHPDFMDVVSNPSFQEWVGKSKVRQELLVRADQSYDAEAASELIGSFKERTQMVQQTLQTEKAVRKDAVKQASTGSVKGSGETGSKKTYRRADIIQLMQTDPERYQALQPEIMRAYAEKRVR